MRVFKDPCSLLHGGNWTIKNSNFLFILRNNRKDSYEMFIIWKELYVLSYNEYNSVNCDTYWRTS